MLLLVEDVEEERRRRKEDGACGDSRRRERKKTVWVHARKEHYRRHLCLEDVDGEVQRGTE